MPVLDSALSRWLSETRRHFHMYPELSLNEHQTAATVIRILTALSLPVSCMDEPPGATALIRGAKDGPVLGLRADMDALPIDEKNDVPYRSRNSGIMHACGHDGHMAMVLGSAKRIREEGLAAAFSGHVKLLFQPAEERGAGARVMIERGILENPHVDAVLAGHVMPDLPAGQVGLFKGVGFASADRFEIGITGKGAHGARPEEGIDPIVAGAHLVSSLQTILSRSIRPTEAGVVTIGKFLAGTAANIIPESASLEGTVRALSASTRDRILQRVREVVSGIETSFGVTCALRCHPGTPVLSNNDRLVDLLFEAARRVVGESRIRWVPPSMGSEDFAFFAEKRPVALIRFGCSDPKRPSPYGLHNPRFDMDEAVLEIGCAVFVEAIRLGLAEGGLKNALVL